MVLSFIPHRLLFNFDYSSLEDDGNGTVDLSFFVKSQVIQLFFIFLTFAVIFFIEAKFNRLDLRSVYKSSSKMETCSRFIIFTWEILCLLSIVTLLPVVGSCENDDICTCKFHINKANYGCNDNATIYRSIFWIGDQYFAIWKPDEVISWNSFILCKLLIKEQWIWWCHTLNI